MLKKWKKKWKDSGNASAPIGGSDLTASGLESPEAALPNGDPSSSISISVSVPSKRPGDELAQDQLDSSRKRKKIVSVDFVNSKQGREILRLALKENIIFAAPDTAAGVGLLATYISLIFADGNATKDSKYPVVVVDAPSTVEGSIQEAVPGVEVVAYTTTGSNIKKGKKTVLLIDSTTLLDNLTNNTIKLKRVGSLVLAGFPPFDDDSSASHPVFRIIKNFYTNLDPSPRPLIFAGLFASMNFSSDITFYSLALEAALQSKIYGLTDESRAKCLAKPYQAKEIIVDYDLFHYTPTTQLVRQLRALSSTEPYVQHLFDSHQHTLVELGPCAADLVWRCGNEDSLPSEFRRILQHWDFTLPNIDITSPGFNITPKLLRLVQILKSCQEIGDDFRGIIFVHRRIVACMMENLLTSLSSHFPFLRIRVIVDALSIETLPQNDVFHHFQSGSCNLLIVNKSVEDLDIPKASVIIKYDLYDSQLSHARLLSRSREDGHVLSMVERDNSAHFNIISRLSHPDLQARTWMNSVCWTTQASVLRANPRNSCDSDSEDEAPEVPFIKDPTTGSKMYSRHSLDAMHFITLDKSEMDDRKYVYLPLFEFDVQGDGRFKCRVNLPGTQSAWSAPSLTRAGARRAASYDVCVELFEKGLLDPRVFPKPKMIVPGDSALPPIDTQLSGTRSYEKRIPTFWSNNTSASLTRLYPVVISVESGTRAIPPHGRLLLLTRQPLPDIPTFKVFFAGLPSRISLVRAEPFTVDERQLQDIYTYTGRLWRGILNKPYTAPLDQCLVLYVPLGSSWSHKPEWNSSLLNVCSHISWDSISALVDGWIVPLKYESAEALTKDTEDAIIQDRWTQFTKRYDAVTVRSDLNPLSKPLDPELKDYANLVEICKVRRKDFVGLKDYEQPLLEVSTFPSFVDRLNPAAGSFTASTSARRYFIPELCAKVTVPASIFRTALLLPCIMRRLDDFLLVKELNAGLFNHCISEELLHVALSAPSAGIEYDYERLELLGDTFLKYLSSIYVFVMYPKADEGSMHNYRQSIINNKFLLKNSVAVGLPAFIRTRPFSLKTWNPSNFPLSLKPPCKELSDTPTRLPGIAAVRNEDATSDDVSSNEIKDQKLPKRIRRERPDFSHHVQRLGDKAVADIAEAIIGAALLSGGTNGALKVAKALKIPLPGIENWFDFNRSQKFEASFLPSSIQVKPSTVEAIEAITGCRFKQPHLLLEALTHFSKTGVQSTNYERLEFIGDAILDFMVVQHIFHRYKSLSPGGLTLLKGAMVSNAALAAVCVWSGLYQHLLFESPILAHDIHEYAALLQRAQAEEYASAKKEGRSIGQYWHNVESPKALSDMVESVIGAIYVSDNYSPGGTEAFFAKILIPFYERHVSLQTVSQHPTKILFELFQSRGCQDFSIIKEHNDYLVLVHDVILASSQDEHGISGAKVASCIGLDALEGDPGFLARTCDCWKKIAK